MKRIHRALIVTACAGILAGCAAAEQTKRPEPEPLVIEYPDPCHTGSITYLYPDGTSTETPEEGIYVLNDGRDGEPVQIVVEVQANE